MMTSRPKRATEELLGAGNGCDRLGGDARLTNGHGLLAKLGERGVTAKEQKLNNHGEVSASQNLDVVDILGNHHRLIERSATEQVGKDEHAIALLAHGGNSGAEILTVGSSLVALKRNDGKSGLVAGNHSDSACEAGCELSMTGKNKANHSNFPSEGVYDLSPMIFGSQRAIALKAS